MILALPADVQERLAEIEAREGIPQQELCHQAITVWSQMRTADQRGAMGFVIMQSVVYEILKSRNAAPSEA